jgi:hypothetical protein
LLNQVKMRGDPVDQVFPGEIFVNNKVTISISQVTNNANLFDKQKSRKTDGHLGQEISKAKE